MTQLRMAYEPADDAARYASSTFPPPRDFQATAHEQVRAGRRAGHKNQLIMAPTGGGKTYLGLNIIQQALVKGRTAIFVCDRTTLINQTSDAARDYGMGAHGIIQADNIRTDARFPFQIASAQTLASRGWPHADVIVVDEAHTQLTTWTRHIMRTEASVIGLSATPFSKGLGKLFTNLINAATMHQLVKDGVLVPMRVYSCTKPDMEGADTADGEWTPGAAAARGMEIVGDVVTEYSKYGEGRKAICFGATVAHCEELCNQFVKAGIMAALFTGETPEAERKNLLDEFRKPDSLIRVLISVEALAKGFDVPDVGCVIDCRPLRKSLSTAIQMWGRMMRCSPGKVDCILLDHSGNIIRFAEDYTDIFFDGLDSLDGGEKLDATVRKEPDPSKPPPKGCPKCGFKPYFRRCMGCGYEVVQAATVEHQPGSMKEVTLGKGKNATVIDKQDLYNQCVAYARANSVPEKQKGRAAHLYKDMAGDWPPNYWTPSTVPMDAAVGKAVLNKVRSLNIKRAKAPVQAVLA